jgi:hypothetical protein
MKKFFKRVSQFTTEFSRFFDFVTAILVALFIACIMIEEPTHHMLAPIHEAVTNVIGFSTNMMVKLLPAAKDMISSLFAEENIPGLFFLAAISNGLKAIKEISRIVTNNFQFTGIKPTISNKIPAICTIPQVTTNK